MNPVRVLLLCAATLALASCNDDDGEGGPAAGPKTATQLALQEIVQNTSETSVPILINDLPVDDSDTTDRATPGPV